MAAATIAVARLGRYNQCTRDRYFMLLFYDSCQYGAERSPEPAEHEGECVAEQFLGPIWRLCKRDSPWSTDREVVTLGIELLTTSLLKEG